MSENVNVDQQLRRFQPKPCRACRGISKKKCMFCGQQWTLRKMDMSDYEIIKYDAWVSHMAYLEKLYKTMIACKMRSTGDEATDREVLANIGDWRNLY